MAKCLYSGCVREAEIEGFCLFCFDQKIKPAILRMDKKPKNYEPRGRETTFNHSYGDRDTFYDASQERKRIKKQLF